MSQPERYAIGIDTGGTYTDAVIMGQGQKKILAATKALTTKGDLAVGIGEALQGIIAKLPRDFDRRDISLVSVSTTLATNAIVEGHGSPVAVILIGFDKAMVERTGIAQAFPQIPMMIIAGGHNHNGEMVAALDVSTLRQRIIEVGEKVSAFAVASAFAVRNPEHEQIAAALITDLSGKPVTLSSELTSALDAPRRAMTAVLNARLIGRITQLIAAVKQSMAALDIVSPLMVVKGDGSLARAEHVALKPIETLLSGPAASLIGARWLSGLDDFILSDIGGTTTDIGILRQGLPKIAEMGAEVGGWRTMVRAIDVKTLGLGGDSEIAFNGQGEIELKRQRVVPIALVAQRYPEVLELLQAELASPKIMALQERLVLLPFGGEASARQTSALHRDLSEREKTVLASITARPQPLLRVAPSASAQRSLRSLQEKGLVQIAGFTPSDAVHVLGLQANWSEPAASLAARLLLRQRDLKQAESDQVKSFCRAVWREMVSQSTLAIMSVAADTALLDNKLALAVARGDGTMGLGRMKFSLSVPLVAAGGPAPIYYPEVGLRLNTEVIFSDFTSVANAVGAAAGQVAASVCLQLEGDGHGLFQVFGGRETYPAFSSAATALNFAQNQAKALALTAAETQGAQAVEISLSLSKTYLPDRLDEDGLLSATIIADALGQPF